MIQPTRLALRSSVAIIAIACGSATTVQADAPIFTSPSYSFTISQDYEYLYVGPVEALDPEWDDFAYVIHDSSGEFSIDPINGYISANFAYLEPGVYEFVVEAVDVYEESSYVDVEVVITAAPPEIVAFSAITYGGGMWSISGVVDSSTPGGMVYFGGKMQGYAIAYDSYGRFSTYAMFNGSGYITAWAVDANGMESPVIYQYVSSF